MGVLLLLNVVLLVLGMFMETIAIMIILVPILLPLLTVVPHRSRPISASCCWSTWSSAN